jgi:ubiquinone/menaquinone biosynthesis C-methylase UbiE
MFTSLAETQASSRAQANQLDIPLGRNQQRRLHKGHPPLFRMNKAPLSAFPMQHVLPPPAIGEQGAVGAQAVHQRPHRRVARIAVEIGPELGRQPARPVFPVGDQGARGRMQEHVAQQVAVWRAGVEPDGEQVCRLCIPGARRPGVVEQVGRYGHQPRQRGQRRQQVVGGRVGGLRILLSRQVEQRRPFGAGQLQRIRQPAQCAHRRLYLAPLFQPGDPGDAQARGVSQFLAPQAGRAAADGVPGRRQAFAVGADEGAEHGALVGIVHETIYTRINGVLVTVKAPADNGFRPLKHGAAMQATTTHHDVVLDQYDARAGAYLASAVHAAGADLDAMAALVGHRPEAVVLDMGCGGGHVSFRLAQQLGPAGKVVAVDLSTAMLETVAGEAARRGLRNIVTKCSAAETLPCPDASFDVVATRYSAHHWQDFGAGLAQMRRAAKPGGLALFADVVSPAAGANAALRDTWLQTMELLRDPSHVRNASLDEWQAALASNGFVVDAVTRYRLRLEFASWIARMRTLEVHVAAIRSLQARAAAEVRDYFQIEADGSFTVDTVLIAAHAA